MFDPENPPELDVAAWLNAKTPMSLAALKGKVVVLSVFQLDCAASMTHGLPQAARLSLSFQPSQVAVVALGASFGAKEAPAIADYEAFVTENKLPFTVAVDAAGEDQSTLSAQTYEVRGSPTILIFDRQGRLRRHYYGQVDDLRLGAEVMTLSIEPPDAAREQSIALEERLAAALIDPREYQHDGDCCGGHSHDHDHHHDHADDGSCCEAAAARAAEAAKTGKPAATDA